VSKISDFVMAEPLFDSHEHQRGFAEIEERREELSYRELLGYADADVVTARAVPGEEAPLEGLTDDEFFEAWTYASTTGYGRAAALACRTVLGLDLTRENVEAINQALRDFTSGREGRRIYEDLYDAAEVSWVVNDRYWEVPTGVGTLGGEDYPDFFGHALRYDDFLVLNGRAGVQQCEKALDTSIHQLSDLDEALDDYTERACKGGNLVAMKSAMPYSRRLAFENSSYAEAERLFETLMQGRPADPKPLHDYLFHRFIRRASDFGLPVQLHTGYLAGNWGDPTWGDPSPLVPVLERYRDVRFDLFHAGWPYSELLGAIGKAFPNVYLDMCWAWAMNPAQMERILYEWLAAVPHNKILTFGGDTGSPFCTVGYALQARRGIARVLERKVEAGDWDIPTARGAAERIMHENGRELFDMD
jgi:predicted TIM-barrel fold metal-dependent hydrolase